MSVQDTLAERGARYGDFTDHAEICQALMRVMQRAKNCNSWPDLSDVQRQSLTVIADKIARILSGDPDYADNWHDIQGYAKLVEDRLPKAPVTLHEVAARTGYKHPTCAGCGLYREHSPDCPVIADRIASLAQPYVAPDPCAECGYLGFHGDEPGTHYATCSQLTAPEEYKAEAQVAFDEAAELSEALARQVSAGTIDTDFDESTLEPAAAMDDDSPRMQAVGQNGNDGEHYDDLAAERLAAFDPEKTISSEDMRARFDPFAGAPAWAKYKAQDEDGRWFWYEHAPNQLEKQWAYGLGSCGRLEEVDDAANANWRDTLITRT